MAEERVVFETVIKEEGRRPSLSEELRARREAKEARLSPADLAERERVSAVLAERDRQAELSISQFAQEARRRERLESQQNARRTLGPDALEQQRAAKRAENFELELERLQERREKAAAAERRREEKKADRERKKQEREHPSEESLRAGVREKLRRRAIRKDEERRQLGDDQPRSLLDSVLGLFGGGRGGEAGSRRRRSNVVPVTAVQEFARTLGPTASRVALGFARITAAAGPVAIGLAGVTLALSPLAVAAKSVASAFNLIQEARGVSGPITAALQREDVRRQLAIRRQAAQLGPELRDLINIRSERDEILREINVGFQRELLPVIIPILRDILGLLRRFQSVQETVAPATSRAFDLLIQSAATGNVSSGALKVLINELRGLREDQRDVQRKRPGDDVYAKILKFLDPDDQRRQLEARFGDNNQRRNGAGGRRGL